MRIAEGTNEGGPAMGACHHAEQVIVGEMTDDHVDRFRKTSDGPEIRSEVRGPSFFDEIWKCPILVVETALEVATADEQEARVHTGALQRATRQLRHGAGAGPLVGEGDQAHFHDRDFNLFLDRCAPGCQTAPLGVVCGGAGGATRRRDFESIHGRRR